MSSTKSRTSGYPAALNDAQRWLALAFVLALALALRVAAFVWFPGPHHPDETFQLFEQAHRFAFGYGIVPWEFNRGIRSPVVPGLLAAVFAALGPFAGPAGYLFAAKLLLSILSLVAVAAVFFRGMRESAVHGIVAGFAVAVWFEIVFFAGRPLTEALAATFLVTALALADGIENFSRRRLAAIGLCLGLCLMLRIHLAPGLLVAAIFAGRLSLSRWLWMAAGGLAPLLLFGLADWLYWGAPWLSFWRAFYFNIVEDIASIYGVEPAGYYGRILLFSIWPVASGLFVLLWFYRGWRGALWLAVALTIVATHSLIPHKEYRFVFPASACLVVVAALGSADLVMSIGRKAADFAWARWTAALCATWAVLSAALAFSPDVRELWPDNSNVRASLALSREPALCGVLFYKQPWEWTAGYAALHRRVPQYSLETGERLAAATDAANAVVTRRANVAEFAPRYAPAQCFAANDGDALCVLMRAGACVPDDIGLSVLIRGVEVKPASKP